MVPPQIARGEAWKARMMAELSDTLTAGSKSFTFQELAETMFTTGKATELGYEFDGDATARKLGLGHAGELKDALERFDKWLLA
jgi:hypothetical protein